MQWRDIYKLKMHYTQTNMFLRHITVYHLILNFTWNLPNTTNMTITYEYGFTIHDRRSSRTLVLTFNALWLIQITLWYMNKYYFTLRHTYECYNSSPLLEFWQKNPLKTTQDVYLSWSALLSGSLLNLVIPLNNLN